MSPSEAKPKILLVHGTGRGHNCGQYVDAVSGILTAPGIFDVDKLAYPSSPVDEKALDSWRPRFSDYDAVVWTLVGGRLSETAKSDFETYIESGGGLLVLHACVAVFEDWNAYTKMIGLGWRHAGSGFHIFLTEDGDIVKTTPWMGVGAGHTKEHPFQIRSRQSDHPIMRGIPDLWMHGTDEFYYGMRGPAENLSILASAFATKEQWGSGDHEPILWTTSYGKGRVATSVLGHCEHYTPHRDAVHCVGYQALIARSAEWVATGDVTIGVPEPFPAADEASIVSPEKVKWPQQFERREDQT